MFTVLSTNFSTNVAIIRDLYINLLKIILSEYMQTIRALKGERK